MSYKTLKKTISSAAAQPLSATSLRCRRALIQPERSNTAKFQIGDSAVTATSGMEMVKPVASAYSIPLELTSQSGNDVDLSQIYVIGTANDIVNVLYDEF